jgi:DNA-binding transcriptional LysR family regulator
VRATKRPPQHLVGKPVGPIRVALFSARKSRIKRLADVETNAVPWIAPDDALPEHPSVVWRKRRYPKVMPHYRVNSILTVMELVALGLGVGVLPVFLADGHPALRQLGDVIDEAQTELWLLTHPESRHLRRVSTVYGHLSQHLALH